MIFGSVSIRFFFVSYFQSMPCEVKHRIVCFVCLVLFFFHMCVWQHYLGPPLWLAEFAVTFDTVVLLIVASCDDAETLGLTKTTRPLLIFRTIICDTRCCWGCGCCCCSWDGTIVTRLFLCMCVFRWIQQKCQNDTTKSKSKSKSRSW